MSSMAGVTEDTVCSRHAAGGTALALSLDHTQGVGAPAVGVVHGAVLAVGRPQSPVVGRDNVNSGPKPTAQEQSLTLAGSCNSCIENVTLQIWKLDGVRPFDNSPSTD